MSIVLTISLLALSSAASVEPQDTTVQSLDDVVVTAKRKLTYDDGPQLGFQINRAELFRAACCNLGESFVTNPSVDVAYDDAATGAKQIKLLGLSGAYVQMLTENLPNYRGAAMPYSLGYVPGTWMQSIQVSKGAASVKNGFESITGQTNIEFLKPQSEESLWLNAYGDSQLGFEANVGGNIHIGKKGWSTGAMLHWEDDFMSHDANHDGFDDAPRVRQVHGLNRWAYFSEKDIFQAGISYLNEGRRSGQHVHDHAAELYTIGVFTNRYSAFAKNAYIIDPEHNTNVAIMADASWHSQNSRFGHKIYDVDQRSVYAQALFETDFDSHNKLSAGLNIAHDRLSERARFTQTTTDPLTRFHEEETSAGAYAQYTYLLGEKISAMGGIRLDHSNLYGWFVTPRVHLKFTPVDGLSLRASAGKGYRHVFALAENSHLMASGRPLYISADLPREEAANYGISISWQTRIFDRAFSISAEYFYTDFMSRVIVDYDSNPSQISITGLSGKSYSHNFQVEATLSPFRGMSITGAWRLNDVKATYGGRLRTQPLTNRYKGLLTASYVTPLELWHFDITAQFNGPGRMPDPILDADGTPLWDKRFKAFALLSAQVTRDFRNFSVYIGGENITGFRQKKTIVNADAPWSSTFDPTMVWGPVHGPMVYAGIRVNISK